MLQAVRVGALVHDRAHSVGDLIGGLVNIWRNGRHLYPAPVGQYANLLDAYMQRIKLRNRQNVDSRSPEIDAVLDSIRQCLTTSNPGQLPTVEASHAPNALSNGTPDFLSGPIGFSPSSNTLSTLPLSDWASNVENGMDGLPSLAAFFTSMDNWNPQSHYPMDGDPNLLALDFM